LGVGADTLDGDSRGGAEVNYTVEIVGCRFRLRGGRKIDYHSQDVALRWLRRNTNRLVNGPSLLFETDYDPTLRQWYLFASADSLPPDAPKFLEDVAVAPGRVLM
jgi:hypothetical protein